MRSPPSGLPVARSQTQPAVTTTVKRTRNASTRSIIRRYTRPTNEFASANK